MHTKQCTFSSFVGTAHTVHNHHHHQYQQQQRSERLCQGGKKKMRFFASFYWHKPLILSRTHSCSPSPPRCVWQKACILLNNVCMSGTMRFELNWLLLKQTNCYAAIRRERALQPHGFSLWKAFRFLFLSLRLSLSLAPTLFVPFLFRSVFCMDFFFLTNWAAQWFTWKMPNFGVCLMNWSHFWLLQIHCIRAPIHLRRPFYRVDYPICQLRRWASTKKKLR